MNEISMNVAAVTKSNSPGAIQYHQMNVIT